MRRLKTLILVGFLLAASTVGAEVFPTPCSATNPTNCSRGTWGDELRDFFSQTYDLNTGYQISPWADVRAYGAACDGITDDAPEIQAAITANELVLLPPETCLIATGLTLPAGHMLVGSGTVASRLKYTGASGYAITMGSTTAPALSYGTGVMHFGINLTQNGGNAIRVAGTAKPILLDLYLEGIPATNTSTGLYIDGATSSNLFTTLINIDINHFKYGVDISSSGVGQVTTVTGVNVEVFCDLTAGSIGINIASANGDGVRFYGGNAENCVQGIKTAGSGSKFDGFRFENNTTDIRLEATAERNSFESSINIQQAKISDASAAITNVFLAGQAPSQGDPIPTNKLPDLTLGGNLTLARNQAATRYIILSDATTGNMVMQAGPGSTSLGGAIVLRGSSHADNGSVIAGLGGSGARDFCVNTGGFGDGTDLFCVNESGFVAHAGVLFAALGTPSNGTMVYCSNCNKATPCTSGGTGAFAKRLNGAWDCD